MSGGGNGAIYYSGGSRNSGTSLLAGVLGIAGSRSYRNGVDDGAIAAGSGTIAGDIYLGARNRVDLGSVDVFFDGEIQAFAFYSGTLTADQVAAVSAAMAAL